MCRTKGVWLKILIKTNWNFGLKGILELFSLIYRTIKLWEQIKMGGGMKISSVEKLKQVQDSLNRLWCSSKVKN